jgi:uncharacterized protein
MTEATLERLVSTYLTYSYPQSTFAFQGGEPTLCGLDFFTKFAELQQKHGRGGQAVSNALQTNGILIDDDWAKFFRSFNWLIGLSLDGTEEMHDTYRFNRGGKGTWRKVMNAAETFDKNGTEYNILCVVSQANVHKARELYEFYRSIGIEYIQFIPLAEFDLAGNPHPYTVSPAEYGKFLCEMFDLWWPERRTVRIRFFDNIAEALAGMNPGSCAMHQSCDSYAVVEYNGDVYPCDFFVEENWKLGNINKDSWSEIARKNKRAAFARKKALPHKECEVCEYRNLCHGGCPSLRRAQHNNFRDLDYFCESYKMIFAKSVKPLRQ